MTKDNLTDVETELRKLQATFQDAGYEGLPQVLQLAADIVAQSGKQAAALSRLFRAAGNMRFIIQESAPFFCWTTDWERLEDAMSFAASLTEDGRMPQ